VRRALTPPVAQDHVRRGQAAQAQGRSPAGAIHREHGDAAPLPLVSTRAATTPGNHPPRTALAHTHCRLQQALGKSTRAALAQAAEPALAVPRTRPGAAAAAAAHGPTLVHTAPPLPGKHGRTLAVPRAATRHTHSTSRPHRAPFTHAVLWKTLTHRGPPPPDRGRAVLPIRSVAVHRSPLARLCPTRPREHGALRPSGQGHLPRTAVVLAPTGATPTPTQRTVRQRAPASP